jgi:nitrite reductase (NO-forming)
MTDRIPPRLSDLLDEARATNTDSEDPQVIVLGASPVGLGGPADRRTFIRRASALGLIVPGLGALSACEPDEEHDDDGAQRPARDTGRASTRAQQGSGNSNSRLDSALVQNAPHDPAAGIDSAAVTNAKFERYAPELPPLPSGRTQKLHWHARHVPLRVSPTTVIAAWTFEGNVPGPIVHTRVGDTVEFTLTNDELMPHSMDFHAAQIDPKTAFRSVPQGESVSFTFKPRFAGAFMYHCGTAPVLMHIASGMYGAIVVSPREPLPPAREFVLVQSEYYLGDAVSGLRSPDYGKMLSTTPDFVAFNGRPDQYITAPIRVRVGDRVRFWVVNAGPSHPCNFHVVGEQFDTLYLGAPPGSPIRGVQTWDVPPGGGMCFELQCDIAGEFPFVNHGFGHGQKGGIGFLLVEP